MIQVWDNPSAADRYTVVIGQDIFAMCEQPDHPQGVNQFVGKLNDKKPPLTKAWGEPIDIADLPKAIQEAICQRQPNEFS